MPARRSLIVPSLLALLVSLASAAWALVPPVRGAAAQRMVRPVERAAPPAPQNVAGLPDALARAIASADPAGPTLAVGGYDRRVIAGDLVHYRWIIRTGPGAYDAFRLHRVVRETRRHVPLRTARAAFLQHGDAKDFVGMFLPGMASSAWPRDFGFAAYLARNGVDVWGIDQDWTLVPAEETDLSFMADWDMARAVTNVRAGMAVARVVRLATGSGAGRLTLVGYSSGVATTAAFLSQEAAWPAWQRQASGWIAADVPLKAADPALRDVFLADLAVQEVGIAAGQFGAFIPFKPLGDLARDVPADDSPFFPGFTNAQVAAMFFYAVPSAGLPVRHFHYWSPVFDGTGTAVGPRLTTQAQVYDFLTSAIAWQPAPFFRDMDVMLTDAADSPWDDHFGDIAVPVLNVTPAGSFGDMTLPGVALLTAADVTTLIPSDGSPPETDIGHIDMFSWTGAESAWWGQALQWINTHTPGGPFLRAEASGGMGPRPVETGEGPAPFAIERVGPNPSSTGEVVVALALASDAAARVELLDVSGRRVAGISAAPRSGRQTLVLAGPGRLAPGVYLVRVTHGGDVRTARVAVVR